MTDQLDPEDFEAWPDHLKLEAVKVYGPTKDWRALQRLYPGLPVRLVKEWQSEQAAGLLVGDPEPSSVPSSAEEPELSEQEQEAIRHAIQLADWPGLASALEPHLMAAVAHLRRLRSAREARDAAVTLKIVGETLRDLRAKDPAELDLGGDVNAGIEAVVRDLSSPAGFSTDALVDELDRRGVFVLAEPPGSGAQKPPVAVRKAPGPRDLEVAGNGAPEPSRQSVEQVPPTEPPAVRKVQGQSRRGPRVPMGGGRRDPALDGLSERDRARLESYMASEPDQLGRGRVRRVGYPEE